MKLIEILGINVKLIGEVKSYLFFLDESTKKFVDLISIRNLRLERLQL